MRGHDPTTLAEALLFEFYKHALKHGGMVRGQEIISWMADHGLTSTIINFALDQLENNKNISVTYPLDGTTRYEITRRGYEHVRQALNDINTVIFKYSLNSSWLGQEDDDVHQAGEMVDPVGGDEWAPLPLEKSGPQYEKAVEQVEIALEQIEGSNGYAEAEPEERNRVVWSLREGLNHIRSGLPGRDQVISMLVQPLKYISEKFAGAAMGESAKHAVRALWDWIGSAF